MARRYWPGEDALGKRIDLFGAPREIIGVVKDVRRVSLEAEATPEFYLRSSLWFMNLVVRTDANPLGQAPAIQRQVQEMDKDVPIAKVSTIVRLVIRQGIGFVLLGVGGGLAASFGLTRLMKTMLFGVSATDPLTFVGIALLLPVVALLACWFPARRATKVDPLTALRHE